MNNRLGILHAEYGTFEQPFKYSITDITTKMWLGRSWTS